MSENNQNNIKEQIKGKPIAIVEIGEVLEFRAGRNIGVMRVSDTGPLHIESLVYHLDDLAVDSYDRVVSEMTASNALPKHITGGLMMGSSHIYTSPTIYTAKNTTETIHWRLSLPRRSQGGPVNDNSGRFKYVELYIPQQDKAKFRIISKKTEFEINKEIMEYVNSLHVYDQNIACGTMWKFFGCKLLK